MANTLPVAHQANSPVAGYTREQIEVIKQTHFKGLEEAQIQYALEKAARMDLDFFSGQVVAWPGKQGRVEVYTTIQGLRAKAEATSLYFPGREATFGYDAKDQLVSATAYVNRWDTRREAWVELSETSLMQEYAHINTGAWQTSRHIMLAKTAEARCLRRVFPMLADLYIQEERGTEADRDQAKASDRDAARGAALKKLDPAKDSRGAPPIPPEAPPPDPTLTALGQRDTTAKAPVIDDGPKASPLTPAGERAKMVEDLTGILAALSRSKKIVLFKRLQMEEPKDISVLTDEDLGNILDAAVQIRG